MAASFNIENFTLTLAKPYLGESYYSGAMDELRIWNTARSAAQIQANMSTPLVGNESGLIAYYRMDEGTGSTLNDASGYANTLQVNNSPSWTTGSPVGGLPTSAQTYPSQTFLTGLTAGTVYHYRAVAANSVGTTFGSDLTFTTMAAPSVQTQAASGTTTNSVMLNASINPNGAVTTTYFQYGLTTSYGSFSSTQAVPSIALNFNGVNQSASLLAPLAGLSAGNTPHSIEAWLKPSLLPATREWALLLDGPHAGAHHWLINADGSTQIGVFAGAQLNPALTSNAWVHLAACFDGTNYTVYTNGVLVGTVAATFNLSTFSFTLAQEISGESYYSGGIDEVRIWNTARSAAQIQANMSTPLVGNESGLIAYYRMDEGTGSTLNDASGNANTLQTANSPVWTTGCPVGGLANSQTYPSQTLLTGLTAGTVYHYRAVAANSVGTTFGSDLTFTTLAGQATSPLVVTGANLSGGTFQFVFTNTPGASFTLLATTNIYLPLTNWTVLTNVVENPAGHFRFTDPQATNYPHRFYRLRSP